MNKLSAIFKCQIPTRVVEAPRMANQAEVAIYDRRMGCVISLKSWDLIDVANTSHNAAGYLMIADQTGTDLFCPQTVFCDQLFSVRVLAVNSYPVRTPRKLLNEEVELAISHFGGSF